MTVGQPGDASNPSAGDACPSCAQQRAQQYRHILGAVPVPLCRLSALGEILDVNAACAALLRMDADRLRGLYLPRFGMDDAARLTLDLALQRARSSDHHTASHIWCAVDGDPMLLDLHWSRAPTDPQAEPEWLVALVDQTAPYREHQALQQAHTMLQEANNLNQELALVADRSPNVVMICDGLQRLRWVNTSFTQQTGYSLAEARWRKPSDLLADPQRDRHAIPMIEARLMRGEPIERAHLTRRRKDGSTYVVESTMLPIRNDDGLITRHILIEQDITERLRADSEREALIQAEVSHQARTEFLSRMSHNMRTPLNAVMGFSQLLKDSSNPSLSQAQKDKLDIIHQAGRQLLHLVDQALQLSRLEHALEAYQPSAVHLLPLIHECIEMLDELIREHHMRVVVHPPDDELTAWADAQRTREIILNLLSNALKYSPAHREVHVVLSAEHGMAQVAVRDQGVGIAASDLPLLFRAFTRLPATQDMASGHGVGLAISQQLAALMHGSLSVSSEPGLGSTFTLSLPLARSPAERHALSDDEEQDMPELPPLRLLCVEDNAMNRLLIEAVFSAYPHVELLMAGTLAEGIETTLNGQPDVVLLDINLPDGNGLTLSLSVRGRPDIPQPMIIALSADALPEHIDNAMACGVDHYLVKPLQIRRLLDILSAYPH